MTLRQGRRPRLPRPSGLQRRVAGFVLVAFVPLGLLTYAAIASAHHAITAEARARVEEGAVLQARITEVRFGVLADTVAALASGPVFTQSILDASADPAAAAQVQPYLYQYRAAVTGSSHAAVLDPAGRLLAISPHADGLIGQDFSYRDWYRGVVSTGRPYVSEAFQTAAPGQPLVVGIAAPIPDPAGGAAAGYLILGYRLESIQEFSARFARQRGVSLTLTDQRGVILSSPEPQPGLVSAATEESVRRALSGETGVLEADSEAGDVIAGFAPIPSLGWAAHADLPRARAFAAFETARTTVLAMSGVLAVVLVLGLLAMVRVWRSRDHAEEELRRREADLAEAEVVGHLGNWKTDLTSGAASLSPGLRRLLGVQPDACPVTRSTFLEQVPADAAAELVEAEAVCVATGEPFVVDHRVLGGIERERWFSTRGEAVRSADGAEIVGVRGVSIDITDRKAMEEEIRTLNTELDALVRARTVDLERANENIESFSYSVSHDLRTPLRALAGYSRALLDDYGDRLDTRGREYAERLEAAGMRMGEVMDDLLQFSRLGRAPMQPKQVDLSAQVAAIIEELRHAEPDRRVETVIEPGVRATADRPLMRPCSRT